MAYRPSVADIYSYEQYYNHLKQPEPQRETGAGAGGKAASKQKGPRLTQAEPPPFMVFEAFAIAPPDEDYFTEEEEDMVNPGVPYEDYGDAEAPKTPSYDAIPAAGTSLRSTQGSSKNISNLPDVASVPDNDYEDLVTPSFITRFGSFLQPKKSGSSKQINIKTSPPAAAEYKARTSPPSPGGHIVDRDAIALDSDSQFQDSTRVDSIMPPSQTSRDAGSMEDHKPAGTPKAKNNGGKRGVTFMSTNEDGTIQNTIVSEREIMKVSRPKASKPPPDGGYGWVIVLAAFLSSFTVFGTQYSFGLMFKQIKKDLDVNSAITALVGSVSLGVFFFTGAPVGRLLELYGCRTISIVGSLITGASIFVSGYSTSIWQICITYGFCAAIGLQMCYGPGLIMIGQYFSKKRASATMIAVAGSGVGTIVMSLVSAYLQKVWRWNKFLKFFLAPFTTVVLFGISFLYVPLGDSLRRKSSVARGRASFKFSKFFDWPFLMSNPYAKYLCLSRALAAFGYYAPSVHLVNYASSYFDRTTNSTKLFWLTPAFGAGAVLGRIMFAKITQGPVMRRFGIYGGTLLISGFITLFLGVFNWLYEGDADDDNVRYAVFVIYQFLYGVFAGACFALLPIVAADLCGVQNLTRALGLAYTSQTLFVITGPAFVGYVADRDVHGYNTSFIITGLIMIISIVPLLVVPNVFKDLSKLIDQEKTVDNGRRNVALDRPQQSPQPGKNVSKRL